MPETTQDYQTMPAGRALDAIVAETILGAMLHEGQHDTYMTLPGERPVSDQRPVPPCSIDIGCAMGSVVEHTQPTLWTRIVVGSKAVGGRSVMDPAPWADVEVGSYPTGTHSSRTLARESGALDTLPAMICRTSLAALAAVEAR